MLTLIWCSTSPESLLENLITVTHRHSEHFLIRRGVVQGDIFSPLCFIIALCVLLEMFCGVPDDCAVGLFGLLIKSL